MMQDERVEKDPHDAAARPRLEARRRAFLDAAAQSFLEKGYAGTTLDDVIARSGGSRQTLYQLFGGKQGLFEALVTERVRAIFGDFEGDELDGRPPEDVLPPLGVRFLTTITCPAALGMYRLVFAESAAMKEVGEAFWRAGPQALRRLLTGYFAGQVKRGTLRLTRPDYAASAFAGMLIGNLHTECVLGLRETPGPEEIEERVKEIVRLFLDGAR
ncbi:TetR/AcrR family transcriptional regulator [Acidocella facilis]|uniref:TetR/AcrR family transcriptional regulator n=2 Tax=Acidocellaceae TaxID=3385905 RepID=UPI001B8039AC|nr:TetR/AcrR family transcriptional regulator [Acidocella facilis]